MLDEDARSGHAVDLELCKLYTKTAQLDSALAYGMKEYSKRPQNIDVNHALAQVYFLEKNNVKAKQHIDVAMSTGSKDPEILQIASNIELAIGNKDEGNKLLAQAKKTNPALVF